MVLFGTKKPKMHKFTMQRIFNTKERKEPIFEEAIQQWYNQECIWPYLDSKWAKTNFIDYIFAKDETPDKPYIPGKWVCVNYALQMIVRYNTNCFEIKGLKKYWGIKPKQAKRKLAIPIEYAQWYESTERAHAFNAINIGGCGDSKEEFNNYYFIEPQRRCRMTLKNGRFPKEATIKIKTLVGEVWADLSTRDDDHYGKAWYHQKGKPLVNMSYTSASVLEDCINKEFDPRKIDRSNLRVKYKSYKKDISGALYVINEKFKEQRLKNVA